ncbi:MAG: hypothetical protein MUF72_06290 [Elainella sp. Prado103]|nr:hypothetical protein [Elainella sp. Prado103]
MLNFSKRTDGAALMESSMLRLVWNVIDETQSGELLALPDIALVKLLLQRISRRVLLSGEEICTIYEYISKRTRLIRDIAESRSV